MNDPTPDEIRHAVGILRRAGIKGPLSSFKDLKFGDRFYWVVQRDSGPVECIKVNFLPSPGHYWMVADKSSFNIFNDSPNGDSLVHRVNE